jgi:trimethylamine---corrinoid protein Co-methyltransferase
MQLNLHTDVELFPADRLEEMLAQAIQVWRRTAFRVQGTPEFFDALSAFGCTVDGDQVRFPASVIDTVMGRIAAAKSSWQTASAASPGPASAAGFRLFTHGQALHICDAATNAVRPATTADLQTWCHLVDAIGVDLRTHPTFIPTDVPQGAADLYAFATIALHSRQPHRVSVYSARMLPLFIRVAALALGSQEAVRLDPVFATKCWVNSPFMITRENVDIAMAARRLLGRPVEFGHMPVAAAAGPVTVAGSLVQNTAESLALNAMSLALDDRLQGITPTSAVVDVRDLAPRQSGPDLMLHMAAGSQMHAHLFGGSPRIAISGVAASTVTPQALWEKALAAAFNVGTGQRQLGIGCLAYSDVGSPVQLLLDRELGRYFQHLCRSVSADADHVGLDTILETVPRGAYFMETEHTARHFREESWLPELVDHRGALAWAAAPQDMIQKAQSHTLELMASVENQCPLSAGTQQAIGEVMAEAGQLVST